MRKLLIIPVIIFVCGCDNAYPKEQTPNWVTQDIDSLPACNIIPSLGINIVKVASTFTATYTTGSWIGYKVDKDKTGLDFDFRPGNIVYYTDSCKLKEDLRWFIKLQITKYISK